MKIRLFSFILIASTCSMIYSIDSTAQETLHSAIVNNSSADIVKAIQQGADVNMGIGNQPPLLLAVLLGKNEPVKTLLNNGANPNINYLGKPLVIYVIKMPNFQLALSMLNKNITLTENDKSEIINYILFQMPYGLTDTTLNIIKKLGYDLRINFNSLDLTKNKWYSLLFNNFGHLTLVSPGDISIFLNNGANPNQIFTLSDNTTWTPLLLVMNNYFKAYNKNNVVNASYLQATQTAITVLLNNGADINQQTTPGEPGKKESPLSYALSNDKSGEIIDFLIKKGASLDAIKLFLNNGGSPNVKLTLENYAKPFTLLLLSVEKNQPQLVKMLIDAGAYINESYSKGPFDPVSLGQNYTLLQFTITKGYGDIINLLIEHGARA